MQMMHETLENLKLREQEKANELAQQQVDLVLYR